MLYKALIRPCLFLFKAEQAHHLAMRALDIISYIPFVPGILKQLYQVNDPKLACSAFGLNFKNPIGLAAGFDKDGKYVRVLKLLGFGFIEVGTVTPKPQVGNPKPRLFRLKKSQAIINRMGFNNDGCDALVERLKRTDTSGVVIGANIGKNKVTPNADAASDYLHCFNALFPYVDYFVVNVSSPNTPDLRELQEKEPLTKLLTMIQEANQQQDQAKPILLKIAPDLSDGQLRDIVEIIGQTGIAGIVTTNTTISRDGLKESADEVASIGNGGLSGLPLNESAESILKKVRAANSDMPIIGVGGIFTPDHAKRRLDAGAQLIQLYTGFIYEGPGIVKRMLKGL